MFGRLEIIDVYERVRRKVSDVMAAAQHYRHHVLLHPAEHFLGDVVFADVILERQIEVVTGELIPFAVSFRGSIALPVLGYFRTYL